ncbi:MAG: recombinase family protein [Acidobacteria bacterium]|nr:recombinase family protein [Verrucomicrobiota bacterium]MBW8824845.1 recombinase family protein [Acidobacteriota bacterium]
MAIARSAAVYARISSDQEGTSLGVLRQLEDCRRLARELGWEVAEEYVDNDVSAFSGKRRPRYEEMLEDLRSGLRDAVVVYHVDRLTRRPIELERFVEVVTDAKVRHVRFVAGGDVDVANGDGLLVLRMLSAVAANESASKSRRVRRKLDQVAAEGRPHGGSQRPFGYEADKVTVKADEAEVIRQLVARFLAGESLRSLATWLDAESVRTVKGGPWRTPTLRDLLCSGRIAGLRTHRGEVVGPAVWEPIVTPADRERVLAVMEAKKTSGRRAPRRYLLTGLLRCGKCGGVLYSSARATTRRYVCSSGPDHGGCGRLTVVAGPLEEFVAAAVLYRLDTPELADTLAGRGAADEAVAALSESLSADRGQLDELAGMWAAKEITRAEWLTARRSVEERMRDTQGRLARVTRTDTLVGLPGNGDGLRDQWGSLNLTRQHAIVRAVLDRAVISAGASGAREFDPARVELVWRV